jgi:hypothetical protein
MKLKNTKYAIAGISFFMVFTALAEESKEVSEFFSPLAAVKGDGVQFTQKGDEIQLKPEDNNNYQVRCWQNGVLVVDESNWRSPQLQGRFVAMKPMNSNDPGLYLVDFFNTFCQIKKY